MSQPADLANSRDRNDTEDRTEDRADPAGPHDAPAGTARTTASASTAASTAAATVRADAALPAGPPRRLIVLLAVSCGLTVANLYYAQPLLSELRHTFGVSSVTAGGLVTATQLGYALGLLLIVPLGDVTEKRRLATILLTLTVGSLVLSGLAPDFPVLLIASLIAGTTLVVTQILVPFAADLAPDESRGRVVGQVMSGLLTGILLSRTVGSLLANVTSWRVVYLTSAALMAVLTLVLRRALPRRAPAGPAAGLSYGALLRSTVRLLKVHPALRRRALYQAAMFGAFSAFWTTISFVLTAAPFHYSQWQVGMFALVGAGGALVAPLAGRWADRGLVRPMTAVAFVGAAAALVVADVGRHSIFVLGAAAVVLDMAAQTTLVLGQQVVYQLDGQARARLNSAFMATFFVGGAIGSQAGSYAYHVGGWTAATLFGAALPVLAFLGWTTEPGRDGTRGPGGGLGALTPWRRPSGSPEAASAAAER